MAGAVRNAPPKVLICAKCGKTASKLWRGKRCTDCRDRDFTENHRRRQTGYLGRSGQLRRYGLTAEQYDALLQTQGERCAICQGPPTPHRTMKEVLFYVDHDHDTGKVRGLLCGPCNLTLGLMHDDIDRLKAALDYLSKHKHRS